MIHNNPISPQNVRVSVDDVITEYQLTPLPVPCYEHKIIGNAAGSFVQWSKDLVMLRQDPILEKKKLHEMTPIQKSSKVESKGSVTPLKQSPQVVGDDINSSDHCAGLSFLLKKRPPSKKSNAFVFEENGDGPIYITLEDINQFLRMSWLNIPIVELFVKYVSKLCKQLKDDKFAFMLPFRLAISHNHDQQKCKDEATDYMTSLLVANKDKHYILAPYIQEAFKLYVPQGGLKNNRKEFIWHHTEVQCPQQKGGTECGFFVMRVLVLEAMVERKLAIYERFGLNFLLLNVYSQGMVLGDTRRECRTITRSLDIIKNRAFTYNVPCIYYAKNRRLRPFLTDALGLFCTSGNKKNLLYLDSGCSRHMTGDSILLTEFKERAGPSITFGDYNKGCTMGYGLISKDNVIIEEVALVDGLKHNILCVSQLCDKGNLVTFNSGVCVVTNKKDNKVVLTGVRKGNVYLVDFNSSSANYITYLFSKASQDESWL
ncbi:hypothetical protein AgCh_007230 [Apium graveolens]